MRKYFHIYTMKAMQTLTLKHPLSVGKSTISKLTFRDFATAEDLLSFDERGSNRQTIALIASLTGTDEALIRQLHISDYRAADAIAGKLINIEAEEKNDTES